MSFDYIFVSPLVRAQQTAEIVADTIGFTGPIITVPELIERKSGLHTGRKYADVVAEHNLSTGQSLDIHDSTHAHKICFSDNSIESEEQFAERVKHWLATELPKYADKNVLIVAHGGVYKSVLSYFESIPLNTAFNSKIFPTM